MISLVNLRDFVIVRHIKVHLENFGKKTSIPTKLDQWRFVS